MRRIWTTDDRPATEQLSYWREVVCEAFTPLAPRLADRGTPGRPAGIAGWVSSSALDTTNCAEITSCTQRIDHGRAEVRRTDTDHVFVNLQMTGHCVADQGGRTCVVSPGGFALFDTTDEYRLHFAACRDELARGTHRSMTELAARWGFSDLSHMNRVFRRSEGRLPSEYRADRAQG